MDTLDGLVGGDTTGTTEEGEGEHTMGPDTTDTPSMAGVSWFPIFSMILTLKLIGFQKNNN